MTLRSKASLAALYGSTGSEFPDNTTELITEGKFRNQGEDLKDSLFNLIDDVFTGAKGFKNNINTIANLKSVTTVLLTVPLYTVFRDTGTGNVLRVYELISGTDAESSPGIIRPNDYAAITNEKVWKLADFSGSGNVWNDRGGHNASGGAFPSAGGSGLSGAIMRFNAYLITTEGTVGGLFLPVGTILLALQNSPTGDYTITGWKVI